MKNSINKHVNIYLVSFFAIIVIMLFITKYSVNNFYINYKFDAAYEYFESNPSVPNEQKYSYLIANGFYVTKDFEAITYESNYHMMSDDTLMKNDSMTSHCCTIKQGPTYLTLLDESGSTVGYATINQYILNDINRILNYMVIGTILIFIVFVVLFKRYMNKAIISRLNHIPEAIESESDENFMVDDEISRVFNKLQVQRKIIDSNNENNRLLMRAISHELKAPIVNIESMLKMHKSAYAEYENFDFVLAKSLEETTKLAADISKLVNFYDIDFSDRISTVNFVNCLKDKFENNEEIRLKKLTLKCEGSFTVNENVEYLNFICANIISNIGRYASSQSVVEIIATEEVLKISNKIAYNDSNFSDMKGNEITNLFSSKININISYKIVDDCFISTLLRNRP